MIRAPWKEMWAYLAADKVHPPLYYLLLREWVAIFGTTVAAIRGYSLLFGMAILPTVYAITQLLHVDEKDKKLFGLVMMSIFAVSPFFVAYSVEARSYSFLAFLILMSVYFFLKMTRNLYKISIDTILFGVLLVAIALTHYLSILVILGYIVAYALLIMIDKKWFYEGKIWTAITGMVLAGWIGFTYMWHAFHLEKLLEKSNLGWIPQADVSTLIRVVYVFLFGVDRQSLGLPVINQFSFPLLPGTVGLIILVASIIAIAFAIQKIQKNTEQLSDLCTVFAIGSVPLLCMLLASSLGLNVYVDRYVIGYATMLLISFGLAWWLLFGKDTLQGLLVYIVLIMFIVLPTTNTKFSDIYGKINSYDEKVTVVVENPLDFVVFKSYFGEGNVKLLQQADGSFYNWALIAHEDEISVSKLPNHAVIISSESSTRELPANKTLKEKIQGFDLWQVTN